MIRNYFKTAWRNIMNNRFYAAINVFGITIGLVVGIFLLLWALDELSFDRFHRKAENIHRVGIEGGTGISKQIFTNIIPAVATFAKNEIPEVEETVRIMSAGDAPFKYKDKSFIEPNFAFVDPSYFTVFDFEMIKGNRSNPFPDNNSLVITERTAKRYFGNEDPIGKMVTMGLGELCKISGVITNYPENSTFQYQVMLPMSRFNNLAYTQKQKSYDGKTTVPSMDVDWVNFNFETFLLLRPESDVAAVEKKLQAVHERNKPEDAPVPYLTQALPSIHLYKADGSDGGISVVRTFAVVAIVLLAIACINYVNLATARAMLRAKEISMRKIIGAERFQLFVQFILESTLLFVIAALLAIALMNLLLPYFNQFSGKQIQLGLSNHRVWYCIGLTLLGTLLASSLYPALLLSSFKPLNALKGKFSAGVANSALRHSLVVVQFTTSIVLIAFTFIIHGQLQYVRSKDLGYDKENIFSFSMRPQMQQHFGAVRDELLKNAAIIDAARVGRDMIHGGSSTGDNDWDGKPTNSNTWFHQTFADENLIDFFGMKVVQGKNFTGTVADSLHFLVNETAVREMGLKDPIGKRLRIQTVNGTIIGVVKDFHFASVHQKIEPVVFQFKPENCWRMYLKTTGRDASKAIAAAAVTWKRYSDDVPFTYDFLDESYHKLYTMEQKQGTVFSLFATVAIIISCLGLFALATYTVQTKTKEVGIRKVLGASASSVVRLLSKGFLKPVAIAIFLAVPIAWWAMSIWLEDFAYRIDIKWWVFVAAGGSAVVIALLTVSWHAVRAAVTNPIDTLRDE